MTYEIKQGDVLERLREMPDNSFAGCLTDPPYGLEFMGKNWDIGVPGVEVWAEMLRVLKPGAILLAFGGTRTHHRLMCAIEDAGFEIRDVGMWLYGSGFPKSLDIGKTIDKAARGFPQGGSDPTSKNHGKYKGGCSEDNPGGRGFGAGPGQFMATMGEKQGGTRVTEALPWDGYGTALKPAYEPIIVAMKPCDGTFANNALKHGIAGINVDASRIEVNERPLRVLDAKITATNTYEGRVNGDSTYMGGSKAAGVTNLGRWPANIILDEEAGAMLDAQSGHLTSGSLSPANHVMASTGWSGGSQADRVKSTFTASEGGASRFFYCAKASTSERGEGNTHPTVKPLDLCRYLAKLILPPPTSYPHHLLVPFSGSGSEMLGALMAGWESITGIEREQKYIDIANSRLEQHCPLLTTL